MNKQDTSFGSRSLNFDFCVVGGGMAGVCAALSAARNGIKTVLVQDRPVLGGNASSEIRMWICGAQGTDNKETGILEELMLRNLYENPMLMYSQWDHVLYGACLEEPLLTTLLNCSVMNVEVEGDSIKSVKAWNLVEQCFYDIHASFFADCSGDSVLRISGTDCRHGRDGREEFDESLAPEQPDDLTMGNSILIQLRGTDTHVPFNLPAWAHHYDEDTVPQRDLVPDGHNFWWLEIGGAQDTIKDADQIRDELLRIAYGVWAYIKNHPDGRGRSWALDWIGSLPGKRESFRYAGDHTLTQNDVLDGGQFDDMVAYGGWPMDEHHPLGVEHPGDPTTFYPTPSPFGIPYRALYSRNIENLFFAGRNISASHLAMSATRVMGTCALMGQAVGSAAAIAVRNNVKPRGVYQQKIQELQKTLMEQDCYLPGHERAIPELSLSAELTSSCGDPGILLNGIERDLSEEKYYRQEGDPDSPVNKSKQNADRTDHGYWCSEGEWIAYTWTEPQSLRKARIVLDSDLTRGKRMLCRYPKDQTPEQMPPMLARDIDIELCDDEGNWIMAFELRDNCKRLIELQGFKYEVTGCRMRIQRTWGGGDAHIFAFDLDGDAS